MIRSKLCVLLGAGAMILSLAACNKAAGSNASQNGASASPASNPTDPIASAESAAPASIAHNAAIVEPQPDGSMKVIRPGRGTWSCMPDSPATPGPDPMCFDSNAGKWADAWIHHKTPPAGAVGLMYMLEGGTDASNTDPYATKPSSQNNWIKTGPHVMIVGSKEILANYPTDPNPDTSAPYVMWAGTPYAHLMVPVSK
jgi:hypothetical protein